MMNQTEQVSNASRRQFHNSTAKLQTHGQDGQDNSIQSPVKPVNSQPLDPLDLARPPASQIARSFVRSLAVRCSLLAARYRYRYGPPARLLRCCSCDGGCDCDCHCDCD